MVSSGIDSLDRILGGKGYPDQSAILFVGPPGIGKEAFCYWFAKQGLDQGDDCVYVTRLSVKEVLQDQRAFGIDASQQRHPFWLSREGGDAKFDIYDLPAILNKIRTALKGNSGRRTRIVLDSLSSSLMVNSAESTYRAVDQIILEAKQHGAILLATFEEGMHPPAALAAMQQLFDGCIELTLHRIGMRIFPLLRVVKMRGLKPELKYYRMVFTRTGPVLDEEGFQFMPESTESDAPGPKPIEVAASLGFAKETEGVFNYLARSFEADYSTARLSIDKAGWRSRGQIAEAAHVTQVSLYGKAGKFGPILKDLISNGVVEVRYFPGERGRGGEVVKFRIAYEKDIVKRYLDKSTGIQEAGGK